MQGDHLLDDDDDGLAFRVSSIEEVPDSNDIQGDSGKALLIFIQIYISIHIYRVTVSPIGKSPGTSSRKSFSLSSYLERRVGGGGRFTFPFTFGTFWIQMA